MRSNSILAKETVHLSLSGFARPLAFKGCSDLAENLAAVTTGWDPVVAPALEDVAAFGTVRKSSRGYVWSSRSHPPPRRWREEPTTDDFLALCNLHLHLVDCMLIDNPRLCLHCAAVAFPDGLVVIPGRQKVGKSTFAVQMAMAGLRVFCDDTLWLDPAAGEGIAPGFLPRVRLPPAKAGLQRLRTFVDEHRGPRDGRAAYVKLGPDRIAGLGERCPITAFVLLDRREGARTRMEPVTPGEMLKQLISRNLAEDMPTFEIFEPLLTLVSRTRLRRLTFSDGDAAIASLRRAFGGEKRSRRHAVSA